MDGECFLSELINLKKENTLSVSQHVKNRETK